MPTGKNSAAQRPAAHCFIQSPGAEGHLPAEPRFVSFALQAEKAHPHFAEVALGGMPYCFRALTGSALLCFHEVEIVSFKATRPAPHRLPWKKRDATAWGRVCRRVFSFDPSFRAPCRCSTEVVAGEPTAFFPYVCVALQLCLTWFSWACQQTVPALTHDAWGMHEASL